VSDFSPARILKGVGGQYVLAGSDGTTGVASARGLFRKDGLTPTPGDFVEAIPSGDPDVPWRILTILPRKNELVRPTIANLDSLIITLSATDPAPDFQLADKLLTVCWLNQIEPILCITKTDLLNNQAESIEQAYRPSGVTIVRTNPEDTSSHDFLRRLLIGRVVSFAGQSASANPPCSTSCLASRKWKQVRSATGSAAAVTPPVTSNFSHFPAAIWQTRLASHPSNYRNLELRGLTSKSAIQKSRPSQITAVLRAVATWESWAVQIDRATIDPGRLARYRQFRTELDRIKPYNQSRSQTQPQSPSQPRGRTRR